MTYLGWSAILLQRTVDEVEDVAKILVGVWEPLIDLLNEKCQEACLRRDAYLDVVLRHEARQLDVEIAQPNSAEARTHISKHLALLPRKPVNILLQDETAELLREVCDRKNVPRDAFVNRVLFLLTAGRRSVGKLFDENWSNALEGVINHRDDILYLLIRYSSLDAVSDVVTSDPFRVERACLDWMRHKGNADIPTFHAMTIPEDFLGSAGKSALGFNVFLENHQIGGNPANEAMRDSLLELFRSPPPKIELGSDQSERSKGGAK